MAPGWPRALRSQSPDQYAHIRRLRPGDWIVIFGTASQVLGVEDHPAFPCAALLRLRPSGFAREVQTFVPADYEPLVLSGRKAAQLPEPGSMD